MPSATRTATGLLESHLVRAQEIERLTMHRLNAEEPAEGEERAIVEQIRRQAIGMQRLFRRWIRVRVEQEGRT